MPHNHTWKRSPRKHKRPPRFFVVCECGAQMQAVTRQTIDGGEYWHIFTTNKPKPWAMRNYSIRLPRKPEPEEVKFFQDYLRKNKRPAS